MSTDKNDPFLSIRNPLQLPVPVQIGRTARLPLWIVRQKRRVAENHSPAPAALCFFFLQAFLQKTELSSLRKQKLTPVARRIQADDFRRAQPDGIGATFILPPFKPLPRRPPLKPGLKGRIVRLLRNTGKRLLRHIMVSVYRKNRKASGKLLQTLLKQPVLAGQTVIHQISRQQQSVRLCRPPESSADSACILRQMQIAHDAEAKPSFPAVQQTGRCRLRSAPSFRKREEGFFPALKVRADSPDQNMRRSRRDGASSAEAEDAVSGRSDRYVRKSGPVRQGFPGGGPPEGRRQKALRADAVNTVCEAGGVECKCEIQHRDSFLRTVFQLLQSGTKTADIVIPVFPGHLSAASRQNLQNSHGRVRHMSPVYFVHRILHLIQNPRLLHDGGLCHF